MRYPKVRILQYHGVGDYPEGLFPVSPDTFAQQVAFIAKNGYRVLSLEELIGLMKRGDKPPENSLALTFDHGYEDAYSTVCPELVERGFPAAFFINPFWIGKNREIKGKSARHMGLGQLRELGERGFTFGLYVGEGKSIEKQDENRLIYEIREKRRLLEYALAAPVKYAAAKEGVPSKRVREFLEKEGFEAFLTQCPTKRRSHPLAVGRIQIDDPDQNIFLMKISGSYLFYKDSRAFPVMRKLRLNRLVHRVSEALGESKSMDDKMGLDKNLAQDV